jgi:ABC-2 type transport system permease protein
MKTIIEMAKLELKLFFREPVTMIFTFGLPMLFLPVLGTVFGNVGHSELYREVSAMSFYTPAYVALVIASIGLIQLPVHLSSYKERGVLRRFRASSISPQTILFSQVAVSLLIAIVGSGLVILMGVLFYKVALPVDWIGVIGAFLIGLLCFVAIGVLLGSILPNPGAAQGLGLILYLVMMLVGGAGVPVQYLGRPLRIVAYLTPYRHVVTLIQNPWLGFQWNNAELIIVAAILVGAALLSFRLFRWE